MSKHIVHRFEFKTIVAGILRTISDPSLFKRYKKYLEPEWIYHNDSSDERKALREIVKLLHQIAKEGNADNLSILYVEQQIPIKYIDEEKANSLSTFFRCWHQDEEIIKSVNDDGIFESFVSYMKILQIAMVSKKFFDSYQTGKIQEAMEVMSEAIHSANQLDTADSETLQSDDIMKILKGEERNVYQTLYPFDGNPLDDIIGGFEPQTLNLFISVTNGGKSMMAHHVVEACIKQKMHVFVACVEDRKKSFVYKLLANLTGIRINRLKKKFENLTSTELEKIKEAEALIEEYVRVEFVYGKSVDVVHKIALDYDLECDIRGKSRPLVNVVDYTGHIANKAQGDKMHEKMRNAYGIRKDFALAHNKICVDFAQVNREGNKNMNSEHPLTQTDLAGAYDLAQVCDNIISINRSALDVTEGSARLHVCKARDGMIGVTVRVGTDFACASYNMADWGWAGQVPKELVKDYEGKESNKDAG